VVIKLNLAVKTPTVDAAAQARLTTVVLVTRKAAALKMLLRADANAKTAYADRESLRLLVAERIEMIYEEFIFFCYCVFVKCCSLIRIISL